MNHHSSRLFNLFKGLKDIDFTQNLASIPSLLNALMSVVGSFSVGLFSVLFITFFFLKESSLPARVFHVITPDDKEERIAKSLKKINELLSRYFIGLILQITILFTLSYATKASPLPAFLGKFITSLSHPFLFTRQVPVA